MEFKVRVPHWKVPESEFIDDVIAVAKKLGKNTVTRSNYLRHGKYHSSTLQKRFKSWYHLLLRAGLRPSRQPGKIDNKLLFENLAEVWIKLGVQPKCSQIKAPLSKFSNFTYVRRFGSWRKALIKFVEYQNLQASGKATMQIGIKNRKEEVAGKNKKLRGYSRDASQSLRFRVFERDGFRCKVCGRSPATHQGLVLHCDHIKPWSKGGTTTMDNLQTLCADCNYGKGNRA